MSGYLLELSSWMRKHRQRKRWRETQDRVVPLCWQCKGAYNFRENRACTILERYNGNARSTAQPAYLRRIWEVGLDLQAWANMVNLATSDHAQRMVAQVYACLIVQLLVGSQ